MKTTLFLVIGVLAVLTMTEPLTAQLHDSSSIKSITIGSHYTSFSDYTRKVGEYNVGRDQMMPEVGFDLYSTRGANSIDLRTQYYDYRNAFGRIKATTGDRFVGRLSYRSFSKQIGQDLLSNLETREWLTNRFGGKILTHDLADSGKDYSSRRRELSSQFNLLLSRSGNVRFIAAHRSILEKGQVQQLTSNHCYSCHVVSHTRQVDKRTHAIEATLQADVKKVTTGYTFGYRHFSSHAGPTYHTYDSAAHPANGSSGPEFKSRLTFSDTTLAVGTLPKIAKMSHKARLKGELAGGRVSGTLTFTSTKNSDTQRSSDGVAGTVHYARRLSKASRLVAKASVARLNADDVFIDLPTYRDGRTGPQINFDSTWYSSANRLDTRGSVELTSRLNPTTTMSLLAGYARIRRDDYPYAGADYTTNRYIGQAKLRFRPTKSADVNLSYLFEKTKSPFASGRGLFEAKGRDMLTPLAPNFPFIFYFQREALRYQQITNQPTDRHVATLTGTVEMGAKANLNWSLKGSYDKNGELDSLDVKHLSFQPMLGLTVIPNPKWSYTLGYVYTYDKSRLPITMPLFDG
jgi:hypothetical protein